MHTKILVIEGVDCCGKTTQLGLLVDYALKNSCPWYFLPEFSTSPIGNVIKRILAQRNFFTLSPGEEGKTVLSETLLLATDLAYQIEALPPLAKDSKLIITDRGLLSLVAYQSVRLTRSCVFASIKTSSRFVLGLLRPLSADWITIMITGVCDDEIKSRAASRGCIVPADNELCFLREVGGLMKEIGPNLGPYFEVDGSKSKTEISERIREIIRASL